MSRPADPPPGIPAVELDASATEGTGRRSPIGVPLLLTLSLLAAFSPVATDLYLPGFPDMVTDLATDASGVQLTLTTFLLGLSAGQVLWGPLSDRFGRRGPLIVSAVICVVAGVLAAVAPSLPLLVLARVVQGLTGAGGLVIGRAVLADLTSGREAARAFTLMMTVGGVAPILAPLVGSLLIGPLGWRGLLWVLAGVGVVSLAAVVVAVPETLPAARRGHAAIPFPAAVRRVLASHEYRRHVTVFVLAFGTLMAYISASPFLYQGVLGMSELEYGVIFGVNAAGMVGAGWLTSHVMQRIEPRRLVLLGVGIQAFATVSFVALAASGAPGWTYAVAIFVAVVTLGMILGTSAGLAMSHVREVAGTGSALLGSAQHALGAVVSPLVGLGGTRSALVPALVMAGCALLALTATLRSFRARSDD